MGSVGRGRCRLPCGCSWLFRSHRRVGSESSTRICGLSACVATGGAGTRVPVVGRGSAADFAPNALRCEHCFRLVRRRRSVEVRGARLRRVYSSGRRAADPITRSRVLPERRAPCSARQARTLFRPSYSRPTWRTGAPPPGWMRPSLRVSSTGSISASSAAAPLIRGSSGALTADIAASTPTATGRPGRVGWASAWNGVQVYRRVIAWVPYGPLPPTATGSRSARFQAPSSTAPAACGAAIVSTRTAPAGISAKGVWPD